MQSEPGRPDVRARVLGASSPPEHGRFAVLDGWRGISILLVLATHMLPIGPKGWQLNLTTGPLGMSLFFAMSGFLITTTLTKPGGVGAFFIRRLFRILPLAYLYLLLMLPILGADAREWALHLSFLVNYFPDAFHPLTLHFWSLCVEVHFYFAIGVVYAVLGRRGLLIVPFLLVGLSLGKIVLRPDIGMASHLRWDEIMAGVVLALAYHGDIPGYARLRRLLSAIPVAMSAVVLFLTCHPALSGIQWLRPYAALAVVGATLFPRSSGRLVGMLSSPSLAYVAKVSYALYVIHPVTMAGWLGTGGKVERYLLKRPISFALTFGLAHLSTRHYEMHFIDVGKRIIARRAGDGRRSECSDRPAEPHVVEPPRA